MVVPDPDVVYTMAYVGDEDFNYDREQRMRGSVGKFLKELPERARKISQNDDSSSLVSIAGKMQPLMAFEGS